ncbi:MAG: twin-arginine translocation signal domain-containing protein [Candidatus Omnitrophota bacterium]
MITARSNGILRNRKPFKVLVCLVTLVAFLVNTVSFDVAWAIGTPSGLPGGGSDRADGPGFVKGLNVDTFTLPEYLGLVRDSFKAKSDKVVIHIQDAHCNYAAQKKIAEIIEYLNKEHAIDTVNLEGGAKDYDLSVFTNIYDKNIREKTADYFVREGLVNGAEYFAINNPEKATLWGIEDTKLYIDNLSVYRESLKHKNEVDKHLNALTHILANLKTKIYSQELLDLDTKYSQYKAGSIEFKDYLTYLIQAAKQKLIDIKAFTSIYLLSQTLQEEGNVDFRKANNERDDLIDRLQKKLSKKSLEELVLKTVEFRSERISQKDFYVYLTNKADHVGIELKDFPALQKYIVYISMYNAIDKTKIMEEIEALENKVKDALYQNDKQKDLNKLSKNLAILKNIFNISLTKEDYKYYIDNEQSFNASNYDFFINKEAPLYKITAQLDRGITNLDQYRENVARFYEYSFKRDSVFLKNIKFNPNQKIAVVVTGGFHTENLCEIFKKQNISYISIMPAFSNCDGYQCPYFRLLRGEVTRIGNMIHAAIASLPSSTMAVAALSTALGREVWSERNIDDFKAWVGLEAIAAKEGWDISRIANVTRRDKDHLNISLENTETPISVAINDLFYQAGEVIDAQMAKGEFFEIGATDPSRMRAMELAHHLGRDAEQGVNNLFEGVVRDGHRLHIQEGTGLPDNQDEHAGGWGVSIRRGLEVDRKTEVILHGIVAGFVENHKIVDSIVKALMRGDIAEAQRLFANADKHTIEGKVVALWDMASAQREDRAANRDFAQEALVLVPSVTAVKVEDKIAVSFTNLVSALRNHIGKTGSSFYENMKKRILNREQPVTAGDKIGNIGQVATLGTFIDEHFALPEEAVREIITNAYDSMHGESVSKKREVQVKLRDKFLSVTDNGSGMSLDTILKKLLPPFEGGKSSDILAQLKNIIDDEKSEKNLRIGQLIAAIDIANLSDTERLTINDIQRRLGDKSIDEEQRLNVIKNIVTFTGRFGIGFYSLLYFLKTDEDSIEVVTSTGTEAHKIQFFRRNGELQTAVVVLNPSDLNRGTSVILKSQSFNKTNAQNVISQFLRFNANAKISVSMDSAAPTVINEEVFNPEKFEHISDETQVETFYSKAKNTSGKTTVYVNVHGVTIMTKQVDGFGMPEMVVFNFPANIGLPISRNKILVNEIFIEKAKDMIRLIVLKPELLSAFFPCIETLESSARASYRNILANAAVDAAYGSWRGRDLVYLPNEEEYGKIKHDGVVLVDKRLLRMVFLKGFANNYSRVGEPLTFASGEEAVIGNKHVYLVDFADETKFVATNDAILINRKHAPKVDSDKALYNALLKLSQEGRFGYVYTPQALAVSGVGQELSSGSVGTHTYARIEDVPKIKRILDSLPDERAKSHFKVIIYDASSNTSLNQYMEDPTIFLLAYNSLVKSGLINAFENDLTKFYELLPWNKSLDTKKDILQVLSENERIKQLQEYFIAQRHPQEIMYLLATLMEWSKSKWGEESCSQQIRHQALERLWDLREFINNKTRGLIISAVLLDTDTYEKFRHRLKSDAKEIDALDNTCRTILNSHDPNYFYSSDTIPFRLFLEGDFKAIKRIGNIYQRLLTAHNNPYRLDEELAISMCNMSEDEIDRAIRSGGIIDVNSLNLRYGSISVLPYYFRFFYGDGWKDKLNFYLALKNRNAEIWSIERILASDIPFQQKKRFLEAVIEEVNSSEVGDRSAFSFPFDFDSAMLSQIKNPALFVQFISHLSPFDTAFLHKKYSLEKQGESVPLGYQYHLRYKNELLRKITIIFRHISDLPINEFNAVCDDFNRYFRQGKMTSRIEPYIQYLLNSQDAVDIEDKELDVHAQRKFNLVDLYDTFLELSSEEEAQEESDGIKGDFNSVDGRIEKVAQKAEGTTQRLTEERRKLLRNTFRAAAQQSVDDLVMIREVVQNVLDETPTGAVNQRVSINTYRKTLKTPEGEQELTVIDVEDTIGMNAERIFNKLLMPFSSSKKDPEKFLGKQGQGFFTLLANSEYVVIKTVRDGKVCILKLIPERQNGQVVDFQVEEERRSALSGENNGTRIQSFIRSALPGLEAARVGLAGQRFAALVNSDRLTVKVNGQQINLNRDRRFATEKTRYGEVEFYSMPGESFMALGGLWVKPLDDELLDLVPPALRPVLLQHGFAINLPFQKIRRIQGGSDIANRGEVYDGIKDAVALGTMKLVIAMFARGELPSLGLLGNGYYDWPYDYQAATDAQKLMDDSADIDYIRTKYFSPDRTNQLAKLLLAIPLDFLREIVGGPISLAELFEKFKADHSLFDESVMAKLPQPIKDAFKDIEEKERKKESQQEAAKELGVPEPLISNKFITLPKQQGEGMAAYWAFLEMSDNIARIGIETMLQENSTEALGSLLGRLEYLRDNPTRSHYYAEANGLSMAHALQGGSDYAWNLLEQRGNLNLFYQYLSKQISLTEFLDKAFEDIIGTLSHELIHILEASAEGTHNDVFLKRQKLMVSAMIGARDHIATVLTSIRDNEQYTNNIQDIQIKNFLDYVVRSRMEVPVGAAQVVISTHPELTVAEPNEAPVSTVSPEPTSSNTMPSAPLVSGSTVAPSPIERTASPQNRMISRRGFIKAIAGGVAVVATGPVIFKIYKALKSSAPQKALAVPIAELVDELLNRNNIDYEMISNSQPYAAEAFPINRQRDFKTYQPGEMERARKFLTQVIEWGIKTNPEFFLSLLSQIKHVVLLENSPHSTGSGFAVPASRSIVLEFAKEIPNLHGKAVDDFTELFVHEMSHNYGENNKNIKIAIPGTVLKNKDIILGPDAENNTGIFVKGIFSEIYARSAEICWENTARNRPQSWMNEEQYMIDVLLSAIMRSNKGQNAAVEDVSGEQEAVNIWNYYWANDTSRLEAARLIDCAQVALWSYGYDAKTLRYKSSSLVPKTERDENNIDFLGYQLTFVTSENKTVTIFAGVDAKGNIKINGEKGWQEFKFKQASLGTGRRIDPSNEGVGADSLAGLLPVAIPYALSATSTSITAPVATTTSVPVPSIVPQVDIVKAKEWTSIASEPDARFRAIKEKLINNISYVSFDEFNNALNENTEKLNQLLGESQYAVLWDYRPHSSKRWVYELCKDKLTSKPQVATYFWRGKEHLRGNTTLNQFVDNGVNTFVVMDDASYSAEQIMNRHINPILKYFNERKKANPAFNIKPRFIIAIPYMTSRARTLINAIEGADITVVSSRSMPSLGEILSNDDKDIISSREGGKLDVGASDVTYMDATLTYFAHRVADTHSFAEEVRGFVNDKGIDKPYNMADSEYYKREQRDFDTYVNTEQIPFTAMAIPTKQITGKEGLVEGRLIITKETIESRQSDTVGAFNTDYVGKDNDVIVVVGVPVGIEMDHASSITIPNLNRGLAKNGFGIRENNKQVITFKIDGDKTAANQEEAMKNAFGRLSPNGRVVLFSPQIDKGPQLAKGAQDAYKGRNVTVVPDAYTDSNLKKNMFPDVMLRVALGRTIAFYRTLEDAGKDTADTLAAIKTLLAKVAANDLAGVNDLKELLKKLNEIALRIKPVDYKAITDWQKSQEAVATAL